MGEPRTQTADDFLEECTDLHDLVGTLNDADLSRPTQFKGWTTNDILAHLYMWNRAAIDALKQPDAFNDLVAFVMTRIGQGDDHRAMQRLWLAQAGLPDTGQALIAAWRDLYPVLAAEYRYADPQSRVPWLGPAMSARAKIIARQMETWAHGQAIFDLFGIIRHDQDRLHNIAHLGVTTYSFAFRNRAQTPPLPKPFVALTAPSGAVWTWNDPDAGTCVSGSATQFCQVVTQTRNIADTSLAVRGEQAAAWMAIAQCFAGPPHDPPAPGARAITQRP